MRLVVNATLDEIRRARRGPVAWDLAVYGSMLDASWTEVTAIPLGGRRLRIGSLPFARIRNRIRPPPDSRGTWREDSLVVPLPPEWSETPTHAPAPVPWWERALRLARATDLVLLPSDADVVFTHLRAVHRLSRRVPIIWSTNGVIPAIWNWRPKAEADAVRARHVALQRACASRADLIVVWTEFGAEHLVVEAGADARRIVIAPPVLGLASPLGPPLPTRGLVRALFVAENGLLKGLPEAIGATGLVPEVELHVVGPPAPLHPPPRTVWHGRQPPERVASMLESADLLLMPARYETYGVCYLEAMRAGTAIVASSLGTTRELVGDAGILVRPADVPGLAAVLTELVREPDWMRKLGEAGRMRYLSHYSPVVTARALEPILLNASIAGRRRRSSPPVPGPTGKRARRAEY